jgi:hypothetical protein
MSFGMLRHYNQGDEALMIEPKCLFGMLRNYHRADEALFIEPKHLFGVLHQQPKGQVQMH